MGLNQLLKQEQKELTYLFFNKMETYSFGADAMNYCDLRVLDV